MQHQVHQPDENEIDLHEKPLNGPTGLQKKICSQSARHVDEKNVRREARNKRTEKSQTSIQFIVLPCANSADDVSICAYKHFWLLSLSLQLSFGVLFSFIMHIANRCAIAVFASMSWASLTSHAYTSAAHIEVKLKPIDLTTMKINRIGFIGCAYFMLLRQIELIAYRCNCQLN